MWSNLYSRTNRAHFIFFIIIEKVTEIKIDEIKENTKSKRISDIIKLYIKNLKKYTDVPNKEIADLLEIRSSTVPMY